MKRLFPFILLIACALTSRATDFNNLTNNTIWVRLSSSWDSSPFTLYGDYMDSALINMNPGALLHPRSAASGGAGLGDFTQTEIPIRSIPSWGYRSNGYPLLCFVHITDTTSNLVFNGLPSVLQAPTNLWNGSSVVASAGWAATSHVDFVVLGIQPDETSDGSPGGPGMSQVVATNIASSMGYLWNDWWFTLEPSWSNDFSGQKLVWSTDAGHPSPAGHLNMAIAALKRIGVDTNVWSASLHWDASNVSTNHCVVTSPSRTGNTLSFTLHLDRMAFGWDILDGTSTNNASLAFTVKPEDGNSFRELLIVPDAVDGSYRVTWESDVFYTTGAQLRNGVNQFTNYVTSLWRQKITVLGDLRDRRGVGRGTLMPTHDASGPGAHGLRDEINLYSVANSLWPSAQGNALIAGLDSVETDLFSLDNYPHSDTQQTDRTISIELIPPRAAPFHK